MSSTWLLAWRYVSRHRFKTTVLVLGLVLTAVVPTAAHVLLGEIQSRMTARARSTPAVLGATGNRFDLVLHALYFEVPIHRHTTMAEVDRIRDSGYAKPIPLHVGFTARRFPLVGTSLSYFDFRGLEILDGGPLTRLGDCVLGASVAAELDLAPGDKLMTDPVDVFDISGTYPLRMRVVGVLAPTGTADDRGVFCDVKTAWIVEGIGHGHDDLRTTTQEDAVAGTDGNVVTATAALVQFNEVTDENVHTFHFHGEPENLPLTAIIAVPGDQRDADLLAGRYVGEDATAQLVVPTDVVDELQNMVFRVKRLYDASTALVLVATVLFLSLVVLLSLRLRAAEWRTMFKIGAGRWTIVKLQLAELAIVFVAAAVLVAALVGVSLMFSRELMRLVLFG